MSWNRVERLIVERADDAGLDLSLWNGPDPGTAHLAGRPDQAEAGVAEPAVECRQVHAARRQDHHFHPGFLPIGRMELSVADTGIGMTPADLVVAMEPFRQVENSHTRKYQGTGLGLPLVKALVELHGGEFRIESEPGVGTTARRRSVSSVGGCAAVT